MRVLVVLLLLHFCQALFAYQLALEERDVACVIAENATVEEDAVVGAKPEGEGVGEVATIAADVTIGKGAKIGPSAMIYEDVKEGEEQC